MSQAGGSVNVEESVAITIDCGGVDLLEVRKREWNTSADLRDRLLFFGRRDFSL